MDNVGNKKHLFFMDQAMEQANLALKADEVPVGAVIVGPSGELISKSHNRTEAIGCQTGHAEILAIKDACRKVGGWRLENCSIYITLEPCLMCFGLIALSRIKSIFYGARSPLFGCDIDNKDSFPLYKKNLVIEGGLRDKESAKLLSLFFERRRKRE